MPPGTLSPKDITKLRRLNTLNDAFTNDIRLGISQSKRSSPVSLRYTYIKTSQYVTITNTIRGINVPPDVPSDAIPNGALLDGNDGASPLILEGNGGGTEIVLDGN